MHFRDMRVPRHSTGLTLGVLSHAGFKQSAKSFVRGMLLEHREVCIPLHIPRVGLVESRWTTFEQLIHNWRKFTREWDPEAHYACVCHRYRDKFPDCAFSADGHLAVPGDLLVELPARALLTASSNTKETVYPSLDKFIEKLTEAIMTFWQHHGLCTSPWGTPQQLQDRIAKWARSQWQLHVDNAASKDLLCARDVQVIRHQYADLIWHCGDHQHTRLFGYCPALYSSLLRKTFFNNAEVFQVASALVNAFTPRMCSITSTPTSV